MKRWQFILISLIIVFGSATVLGQQSIVVLKGKITDMNNAPLPYAKITETQTGKSTLSNHRGIFYLDVPAVKSNLHVSYMGYLSIDTTLNFRKDLYDTVSVTFQMIPSVKELNVITISSEPFIRVFETTNLNILDYTFFGQNILLLVKSKDNYQIRLLDPQEKILIRQNLNFKPVSFIKDCLGIMHIAAEDSLYPIHFDAELFSFPHAIPISDYIAFIQPCVASGENFFFLRYLTRFNQAIDYFSQRKKDDFYQLLRHISDPEKVKDVEAYARDLELTVAPDIMGDIFDPADVRASREKTQDQFFFELVVTNAVYAPLIQTNNAVYVFDHLADSCFVFSQNSEPVRAFSIEYHLRPHWANQLITDEANEKIYAVYEMNGIYELAEINPETGQLHPATKLIKHTYPQKIRIKDGWIYYLHHEYDNAGFNKLYKVRLGDL